MLTTDAEDACFSFKRPKTGGNRSRTGTEQAERWQRSRQETRDASEEAMVKEASGAPQDGLARAVMDTGP
jgi:hypothetical protein